MKTLDAFEDNLHLKVVDNFYIQLRVASTTGWNAGDLIFLEVSSCTNNATRRLVDGPKKIYSIESSRILSIKSYGLAAEMDCGSGKIWLIKKEGAMKPNGIFTVTNSQGTTVQFSTGADSEHVGTCDGAINLLGHRSRLDVCRYRKLHRDAPIRCGFS